MAGTRSTTNSELHDQIALTAHPVNGGSVGVKSPYPEYATFQVDNPNVRQWNNDSNATVINGIGGIALDPKWETYSSLGDATFYREGSRVFFDGSIRLKTTELWNMNTPSPGTRTLATLPEGFRPINRTYFSIPGRINYYDASVPGWIGAQFALIDILTTGEIRISYIHNIESNGGSTDQAAFDRHNLGGDNAVISGNNSGGNFTILYLQGSNFRVS